MIRTIRHGIEYLIVLLFFALVRITPLGARDSLARWGGLLGLTLTRRRGRIALSNLKSVELPATPHERLRIVTKVYTNLAANAIDAVRPELIVPTITVPPEVDRRLTGLAQMHEAGRPLIFVTGHFGAWELLGQCLATRFPDIHFLAKTQKNLLVDRLLNRRRERLGGRIVPSQQAPRLLSRQFKQNHSFLFVADQEAGADGVLVEFLGRPTSYARGPALYSYQYEAPLVPAFARREKSSVILDIAEAIHPNRIAAKEDEVKRLIQTYSDALEDRVRKHPGQWLWTHRRWKSQSVASTTTN
jgi:KDO2-lipid IV(A) lauroyltransferase